jgi:hypothetical protein
MRVKSLQTPRQKIRVATIGNKIVGYTLTQPGELYSEIQELIAINRSSRLGILEAVEHQPRTEWLVCSGVCDRKLSSLYKAQGFSMYEPGWGRVMATCIDGTLNNEEIAKLYGVKDGLFTLNALDSF